MLSEYQISGIGVKCTDKIFILLFTYKCDPVAIPFFARTCFYGLVEARATLMIFF